MSTALITTSNTVRSNVNADLSMVGHERTLQRFAAAYQTKRVEKSQYVHPVTGQAVNEFALILPEEGNNIIGRPVRESYCPHDIGHVAKHLIAIGTVVNLDDCEVSFHWNDGHVVEIMLPGSTAIQPGDDVRAKLTIRAGYNATAFSVSLSFWRLVCSNGMFGWSIADGFKTRHTSLFDLRIDSLGESVHRSLENHNLRIEMMQKMAETSYSLESGIILAKGTRPVAPGNKQTSYDRIANAIRAKHSKENAQLRLTTETRWSVFQAIQGHFQHDTTGAQKLPTEQRAEWSWNRPEIKRSWKVLSNLQLAIAG